MSKTPKVGDVEITTQKRLVNFFQEHLGYEYLGDWQHRDSNTNIEEEYLKRFLKDKQGYSDEQIKKAISILEKTANETESLYDVNRNIYGLLRYGVEVKLDREVQSTHIHFIDWKNSENNHFAIAEEVTITGKNTKRPDIVIYVNGIALGVIELKRSKVSVSEGIRQNLDNQDKNFIQNFFTTQQLIMAGNDTQGLHYGTIETPEKYFLTWKEDNPNFDHNKNNDTERILKKNDCGTSNNILDCDILRLLNKERFLEIIHDFVVYDSGVKKICRQNQYFGVKSSQESIRKMEGGIIWHTQGSGKSLTMVWLAKWIRENIDDSRVLLITDRTELDEQIEKVFNGVNEKIYRTKNGNDLINQLNKKEENLIASLVHKFGRTDSNQSYDDYIGEVKKNLPSNFSAKGNIFVFVDECHRTQSGKLHNAMQEILPNAIFFGFTGTPLLKKDKATSKETFGNYIHTYRFNEAIEDEVVLDLKYEARSIEQNISSQEKIDQWFESKTSGLSDIAKAELKKKWGTMQKVLSSKSRLEKIVSDIIFDFETKPRLQTGRGNAMLVAGSIYEAVKYYELFTDGGFNKCAVVTSYKPTVSSIKGTEAGEEQKTEDLKKYEIYRKMIASFFGVDVDKVNDDLIENFEKEVKEKFIKDPGQMKLLIVVDKLLTGFDAPAATYLYIDKNIQDHGLFQAICRVNRLDNNDITDSPLNKDFGYIIDYKDLFKSVEQTVEDYTDGAFKEFDKKDVSGLLENRLEKAKKRLDDNLDKIKSIIESVGEFKSINEYSEYFIGNGAKVNEQLRLELYKTTSALVRSYMDIANEMEVAGYSKSESVNIKKDVEFFVNLRDELKLMSGDQLDLKRLNPSMRHLIDSYIQAEDSKKISAFNEITLLDMIAKDGMETALKKLPNAIGKNKNALAETIENNIRKLITDEQAVNPAYYDKMSKVLSDLVEQRKKESINYEEYLEKITELIKHLKDKNSENSDYPETINTSAKKALFDNLNQDENFIIILDESIRNSIQDDFRNNTSKKRKVRNAIKKTFDENNFEYNNEILDNIFNIVLEQDEY